jgi:predicted kinase
VENRIKLNINKEGNFLSKVILICGKICSGKTTYAKDIAKRVNAVILSVDELMLTLFGQHVGEKHDEMVEKTENYLYKKSIELISKDLNVILDWGFWTKEERLTATKYYTDLGIKVEWHYIEIDDITWNNYLEKRNSTIVNNEQEFYYIDENIAKKISNIFEEPKPNEMNVWYNNKKNKIL